MSLMFLTLTLILFIIVYLIINFGQVLNLNDVPITVPLMRFDNVDVALIEPPAEITIEGNTRECHKTLTPCVTHMDCDQCREGLANCQYFHDKTILTMRDANGYETEHIIEPGESYCMALDRERARFCNPNTGVWVLAESAIGFSLLCSCLTPGLVTQLNMYEDCNVAVGCQPNGRIVDLNEHPLRCECDSGYTPDYDTSTETPFCRPLTVRDMIYDENFFPRAPCQNGFVQIDHPALDSIYRQELRLPDICVVDPCSVDPISGQRTSGRLAYYRDATGTVEFKYCICWTNDNLFSVYSPTESMIGNSTANVSNACIQPFNTSIFNLARIDYKWFWGQNDQTRSDDEIVAAVSANQLSHDRYRRIAYSYLTVHPNMSSMIGLLLVRFSLAYSPANLAGKILDNENMFQRYRFIAARTSAPCLYPGAGRCIVANYDDCIRRHAGGQVWTAETFTGSWCILSRENEELRIWSPATRYPTGQYPLALRINALFSVIYNSRNFSTVQIVEGGQATSGVNVDNLATLLNTYQNYSV
uniref:PIF-1 n=1 Tax=Buzura suppressaria nuclear polyhedrosis virus TaxID=74320 RepID=A0A0N7CPL4_NPVBS|nr:PIF-1 [Buzura suppressaria nucleopolyhedrovirus]QYF10579.1 per os infectivity factor 1 [Buzura suppressaria nucleopolyhedrovirus]